MQRIIRLLIILTFLLPQNLRAQDLLKVIVKGSSMSPMFKDGDELSVLMGYYQKKPIQKDDVVLVKIAANKRKMIKKVQGLSGESFAVVENGHQCQLVVNQEKVINSKAEVYSFEGKECSLFRLYEKDYKGKVPPGSYLLLGDNLRHSKDARYFGFVDGESILDKVLVPKL